MLQAPCFNLKQSLDISRREERERERERERAREREGESVCVGCVLCCVGGWVSAVLIIQNTVEFSQMFAFAPRWRGKCKHFH